jgi:uncharacterized membrane protein YbhN (UPF0104 family)
MKVLNSPFAGSVPESPIRRRLLQSVRWLMFLAVFSAIAHRIWIEKGTITSYPLALHLGWILLSMACYCLAMAVCAFFWWLALRDFGGSPSLLNTAYAYFAGHLGKYVPGKGLVIVIRTLLVRGPGIGPSNAAFTSILETLFLMAVGALVCLPIFVWAPLPYRWILFIFCLVFALSLGIVIVPPVTLRTRSWLAKVFPAFDNSLVCRWKTMVKGFLIMLSSWALCGLSLLFVFKAMGGIGLFFDKIGFLALWAIMTASVAFATIAGFVSMIPGGLGTREWVLIETLGPITGTPQVMLAAGILRLQWVITELLAVVVLWYFDRQWTQSKGLPN